MKLFHAFLLFACPDIDLITPNLDGTILPGITRASTLELAQAHAAGKITLPGVPSDVKIHTHERVITMSEVSRLAEDNRVLECFGVGTAVLVAPVGRIGWKGKDVVLPAHKGGLGPIGNGLKTMILDIQTGATQYEGWSVPVASVNL